jgi:hypothetical protein
MRQFEHFRRQSGWTVPVALKDAAMPVENLRRSNKRPLTGGLEVFSV